MNIKFIFSTIIILTYSAFSAETLFQTPLSADDLDPAAFAVWVDGKEETSGLPKDGPRHAMWTKNSHPEWDGVTFGNSKNTGARHLRIGFKGAVPIGTILARAGGKLSVLKPGATYPGNLNSDADWIAAERLKGSTVCTDEAGREDYVLWVLPPGTATRALRFTHSAAASDNTYAGWLGGAVVIPARLANVAPQGVANSGSRDEAAAKLNNESNDGTWGAWDNGKDGGARPVTALDPEWITLTWAAPVKLCGLNALWAGMGAVDVFEYAGPAERHPREAEIVDWKLIKSFSGLQNGYPFGIWPNWMDFGRTITTRAIRLHLTEVSKEQHPHLKGNTRGGKRVWLGELLALQSLNDNELKSALIQVKEPEALHAPVPVRFKLDDAGFVTLVIEDAQGKRVRNLVSEQHFPAGENETWWDCMDDFGRDAEAARHGLYHVTGQFVSAGEYHVRGLFHKGIGLSYEFSVYTGGNPAWETADKSGGWLTNHTPPSSILFVGGDNQTGKPAVLIGSYVAEGGSGLAWVDLDGNKKYGVGWVGGNWTGAPYLARDDGDKPQSGVYGYVGAAWESDLRLTALTKDSQKPIVLEPAFKYPHKMEGVDGGLAGLAVHNGKIVASLRTLNKLLFVDAAGRKVLSEKDLSDPRGLAFDAKGRLLALSGKTLLRFDMGADPLPEPQVLIPTGLEDPQGITLDKDGNIYVSDRGSSHQIKVCTADGKVLRSIGKPGVPKAGPYDPEHMNNPRGLGIDANGHLWVAEEDFQPKRVSVWSLDGKLWKAFYGPSRYGGGGTLDTQDKTRFFYDGMEFKLDWKSGAQEIVNVIYRPAKDSLHPLNNAGAPETPIHIDGRTYMTNAFNSSPTSGAAAAMLWLLRDGVAVPVAAFGRANEWDVLKEEPFKSMWPKGADPKGGIWDHNGANQAYFLWCDTNGDGEMQPGEVTIQKGLVEGVTVMPDLSLVVANMLGKAVRFAPRDFSSTGVPHYDLAQPQILAEGAQGSPSSGGNQVLAGANNWAVFSTAPKPFSAYGMAGVKDGVPMWTYPSMWPGLHASHEGPVPDRPGELVGTTRLLGGFVTPKTGDAGALWAINGNMGNMYLFTADGLFVSQFFQDVRQGKSWSMPNAERGMQLNDLTLHDENFWPSITQSSDGEVYLVDGGRSSLVHVNGLDKIKRLPETMLKISAEDIKAAQEFGAKNEAQRQSMRGSSTLKVSIQTQAPSVDGKLDDWSEADWASIDKSGTAANFNSNSKPYDVNAAVIISGDRLYAAFRTNDPQLLRNTGENPTAPFKTGGALDIMIGTNPNADPKRTHPVEGDVRLLVTQVKKQTLALLYRAVVPGTKDPVAFSSPWRTITCDKVENVSTHVQFAASATGEYELSIPLAILGLKPEAGKSIKADVGILRGDGTQTMQRVYWNNKATGIVSDVPSEAELTPGLWGRWTFR